MTPEWRLALKEALAQRHLLVWKEKLQSLPLSDNTYPVHLLFQEACRVHWKEGIQAMLDEPLFWQQDISSLLRDFGCMNALVRHHQQDPKNGIFSHFWNQLSTFTPQDDHTLLDLHGVFVSLVLTQGKECDEISALLLHPLLSTRSDIMRLSPQLREWLDPANVQTPKAQQAWSWVEQTAHPGELVGVWMDCVHYARENAPTGSPSQLAQHWLELLSQGRSKAWWEEVDRRWCSILARYPKVNAFLPEIPSVIEKQILTFSTQDRVSEECAPSPTPRKL